MKKNRWVRRRRPAVLLAAGLFLLFHICINLGGCGSANQKVSRSGFYFDTIITITLYNTSNEGYIDKCFDLAAAYERKFSNTIATSEISAVNEKAGSYVKVSEETLDIIQKGIEYGEISGGRFDITVGGLSGLWNFSEIAAGLESADNEADASVLPDSADIKKAAGHVDYTAVKIKDGKVKLSDRGAKLDLGGIAKGYIADRMRDYLRSEGITAGIISLGGNVLTLGEKEEGMYTVGIQRPFAPQGTTLGTLSVRDASVVSSGIYERYYRVDGRLYHHILDTDTGYPVENNLYQVTIISESSMAGDALSTACFALGLEDGMALVEQQANIEAIFVTDDGKLHCSSGIGDTVIFNEN